MAKRKQLITHGEARCRSKRKYVSERIAKIRAEVVTAERGVQLYAYKCPHCSGWHHTRRKPPVKRRNVADDFEVLTA